MLGRHSTGNAGKQAIDEHLSKNADKNPYSIGAVGVHVIGSDDDDDVDEDWLAEQTAARKVLRRDATIYLRSLQAAHNRAVDGDTDADDGESAHRLRLVEDELTRQGSWGSLIKFTEGIHPIGKSGKCSAEAYLRGQKDQSIPTNLGVYDSEAEAAIAIEYCTTKEGGADTASTLSFDAQDKIEKLVQNKGIVRNNKETGRWNARVRRPYSNAWSYIGVYDSMLEAEQALEAFKPSLKVKAKAKKIVEVATTKTKVHSQKQCNTFQLPNQKDKNVVGKAKGEKLSPAGESSAPPPPSFLVKRGNKFKVYERVCGADGTFSNAVFGTFVTRKKAQDALNAFDALKAKPATATEAEPESESKSESESEPEPEPD